MQPIFIFFVFEILVDEEKKRLQLPYHADFSLKSTLEAFRNLLKEGQPTFKRVIENNMTMTDLYLTIKNKEKYVNLENAISLAEIIWEEFQNFITSHEKARIEHSNLMTSQKNKCHFKR